MRQKGSSQGIKLTSEERALIFELVAAGQRQSTIAEMIGCSDRTIRRLMARPNVVRPRVEPKTDHRLSLAEREEISLGIARDLSFRAIGRGLGRAASTISREIAASGGRRHYRATHAEADARRRHVRPRQTKLERNEALLSEVETGLRRKWSPQQICAQLRRDFPEDPSMRISHETIYQSLYVQARGTLKKELARSLRTGRTRRKPQSRLKIKGKIKNMVLISERPPEVEDRAIPGHWEGDLIIGKGQKSAIATLVERRSRFLILAALPNGRSTSEVTTAIAEQMKRLPVALRKSLTWDQGKEMAGHVSFSVNTQMDVYFCDPHSPWQRGSNENTNGLLRQYFPKGTDLKPFNQDHLNEVARELNERPRQTLEWMKPYEVFKNALVASTG